MNEKIEVEWKADCQGKWDYDADIIRLSCRYYPRGGGFWVVHDGQISDNDTRPEIKPSAYASILFGDECLLRCELEGETESEVKSQVEAWASEQMGRIEVAIRELFAAKKEGGHG